MHPASPYYHFSPDSIGSLHRCDREGKPVYSADVIRLLHADIANASDPVLQKYILPVCEGTLNRPRGRPRNDVLVWWKLVMAESWIEERAEEIKAQRRCGAAVYQRGDLEPCVQAAEEVGAMLKLPRGRALLNAISRMNNGKI